MIRADVEALSALSDDFYNAAYDGSHWRQVADGLKEKLNLSTVCIGYFDQPTHRSSILYGDCDSHFEALYWALSHHNPFAEPMLRLGPGSVFGDHTLMPEAEFIRSTFFNEWLRPQGEHSAIVSKFVGEKYGGGFMILQRGGHQEKFSAEDERLVRLLTPALAHAMQARTHIGAAQFSHLKEANNRVGIGLVVTDASGRIVQSNETAAVLLELGLGLSVSHGRLEAASGRDRLTQLIFLAAQSPHAPRRRGGDMITHAAETGLPGLAISVHPVNDGPSFGLPIATGAMVFLQTLAREVEPAFEERMQAFFGLTQREAALAGALASGQSLGDAARARAVSLSTVRSQLAQLFRKTGTTQQSQLVALLRGIRQIPPLNGS